MTKPTWDAYAQMLAYHYAREMDFLAEQGLESEINWGGGPCTNIRAGLDGGRYLLATNAYDSSELAKPGEPAEDWYVGIYDPDAEDSEFIGHGIDADFAEAYRKALASLEKGNAIA